MSFNPGTEAIVYLNGYNISGYLKSAGVSGSRDLYDSTTLGDTDREFVGGLGNAVFNADGLYEADSVSPKIDDLLYAALELAADAILTHLPAGDGLGNRGMGIDGEEATYDISSPVDELVSVTLEVQSSVGAEPVRVLHPIGAETPTATAITSSSVANPTVITTAAAHGLTTGDSVSIAGHTGSTPDINGTHTATVLSATTFSIPVNVTVGGTGGTVTGPLSGSGTGVDNGASSADGGSAYLHVTAHDRTAGDETATIKVQHSADDITYADLITFDAIASATPQAQRKAVTGTVNRWTRDNRTMAGTTPSTTYHLAFSRH